MRCKQDAWGATMVLTDDPVWDYMGFPHVAAATKHSNTSEEQNTSTKRL